MWVGDLEANGFLDQADRVHCGVFRHHDTGEVRKFHPGSHVNFVKEMLSFLDSVDSLCMHNGVGYDWPLLEKLYGYEYKGEKLDTMVMSRLQQPKRQIPYHCPNKKAPHSVEVWGYRLGRGKPEHNDWETYSPEMLHRCTEDVEIQALIYDALETERGGRKWEPAIKLTTQLFTILQKQADYGWLVDQGHMHHCIHTLTRWMSRIDKALAPRLPKVLEVQESKKAGVRNWVREPFLKSGQYNKNVLKWMELVGLCPEDRPINGPFSRVQFRPLDPNSRVEAIKFLLDSGWIPKEWNVNDDGEVTSPKLDKNDPFDGVEGKEGQLFSKRIRCKARRSIVEGLFKHIREDGRIASVVSGLAETGRAKHKVIVNIPNCDSFFGKWMRKIFIAKEGYTLVGCDAASCQDRMLAARADVPEFTEMLLNGDKAIGTDGHSQAMDVVNAIIVPEGHRPIIRGKAKGISLGWKFGLGDENMGKLFGLMDEDAKRLGGKVKDALADRFAAQAELVERLTKEWRKNSKVRNRTIYPKNGGKPFTIVEHYNGWVVGLDGRPIFIASEHAILVYVLQSDEAITMSAAYCILYKRLIAAGFEWGVDWAFVCWYHDEYTLEIRDGLEEQIADMAEQAIVDAGKWFKLAVPQAGDAEIGKDWNAIH